MKLSRHIENSDCGDCLPKTWISNITFPSYRPLLSRGCESLNQSQLFVPKIHGLDFP